MQSSNIQQISWWVSQLNQLVNDGHCVSPSFLKPFHLVTTALAVKQHHIVDLKLPDELSLYAARMNLWEAAEISGPSPVGKNSAEGRFLPVESLRDRNSVANSAAALSAIVSNVCSDEQTQKSLYIAIEEILENCFAHARVEQKLWGLACAQSWPGGKKAQIAIADIGIGIRASLAENSLIHLRLSKENSCEMATELGVTSKPGQGHDGYGLALARQLIENNQGSIVVLSQSEYFSCVDGNTKSGTVANPWPGTLVMLEWNTNRPLDVKAIYSVWLSENMEEDEYDF